MTRPQMGLLAWIGVIIVIGLIVTYPKAVESVATTGFTGIGNIIKDLQTPDHPASH